MRILRHPVKKLTLVSAFGGGYVLGARAGRERYEQIRHIVAQVTTDPAPTDQPGADPAPTDQPGADPAPTDPSVRPAPAPARPHPLLADEHVDTEDELVYSTGPDIEETIDELAPTDDDERL